MRNRLALSVVLVAAMAALASGAVQGPIGAPRADLPGDRPQQQAVTVREAEKEYTLTVAGAVDGVMTRMPVSYKAYVQGWQPNVATRIENAGETDVVNPWLTVNGRGDWRTIASIVVSCPESSSRITSSFICS